MEKFSNILSKISFLKLTVFPLLLVIPVLEAKSYERPRPNYSPAADGLQQYGGGFDNRPPSIGAGLQSYRGSCVFNCQCWAHSDAPQQPVYVNCTSANKDTVPQVNVLVLIHQTIEYFLL